MQKYYEHSDKPQNIIVQPILQHALTILKAKLSLTMIILLALVFTVILHTETRLHQREFVCFESLHRRQHLKTSVDKVIAVFDIALSMDCHMLYMRGVLPADGLHINTNRFSIFDKFIHPCNTHEWISFRIQE